MVGRIGGWLVGSVGGWVGGMGDGGCWYVGFCSDFSFSRKGLCFGLSLNPKRAVTSLER